MRISAKKITAILFFTLLLIAEGIIGMVILDGSFSLSIHGKIQIASIFCVLSFVFSIISWKSLTNELICPYLFFYACLFLFCCGQSLGWAFGLDLGDRDLMNRIDYGLNNTYVLKSLVYSMLSLTAFHIGALCFSAKKKYSIPRWNSEDVTKTFSELGTLLLIICIPAFVAETIQLVVAVMGGGYLASYEAIYNRSTVMKILSYVGDYFQPCLLLLLVANRKTKSKKRTLILCLFIFDIITQFYIGGRNRAVLSVIGIVLAYHYFIKPISKKYVLLFSIAGYFGIALMNAIALVRTDSGRGIFSVFEYIELMPGSVLGGIISELGWSMSSTSWTMMYVDRGYGLQNGMTYIMAPLGVIPNLGFWTIHPAKAYDPSEWLQTMTNASYGLGYTMVAETYVNFGWFGWLFMFLIGAVLVHFLDSVRRCDAEKDILKSTFQIMFIMTLTKLLVRSTFASTVRSIGFVLIPIYLIVRYRLSRRSVSTHSRGA